MTTRRRARGAVLAAVAGIVLLTSACGDIVGDGSAAAPAGTSAGSGPATPGVTDTTIRLGILTDLSGPFSAQGQVYQHAFQSFWETVNASGGVCKRQVELVIKDHGYDVQKATADYEAMRSQVLAMQQVLGSPMNAALTSQYDADKIMVIPAAYSSQLLASEHIVMANATYDYQTIDGLDWMLDQGLISSGDKIGHLYFPGDLGANTLRGSQHVAEKRKLTIIPVAVNPAQTDVTTQIASLKAQGVSAIVLSVGARQTTSAAIADASLGLNVPMLGFEPSFSPGILKTAAAAPSLLKNLNVVFSFAPPTDPALDEFVSAFRKRYPKDALDFNVSGAFAHGAVMRRLLHDSCRLGAPTRDSLFRTFRAVADLNTGGIVPRLDFSRPGASPTIEVRVYRPDTSVSSGLKAVTELISGSDTSTYRPPALVS